MFACTEPRSANQNLSLQFTLGPVPLTPLFAIHRSSTQVTENPNTLSPFLATHTDIAPVSPLFATHTKTAGVYTNNSHSGTSSSSSPKSAGLSFHALTNCPLFVTEKQLLHFHALMNCYSRNSFLLIFMHRMGVWGALVTNHQSPLCPTNYLSRGRASSVLLEPTSPSSKLATGPLFLLFTCLGGCDG